MPDTPAPTPASDPVAKSTARSRAPISQALIDDLDLAERLSATAAKPDNLAKLADEDIDAAFLQNVTTQIAKADAIIATISATTADKKSATQTEEDSKAALLGHLKQVQSRAKRTYPKTSDPQREKYFIGQRIDSNRALLERSTRAILATLATDRLKAHKPAHTAALSSALDDYVKSQAAQSGGQPDATTAHANLATQVKVVADLRREIQYAADNLWPAADKKNAAQRRAFGLSPDKALK
jgi:hypothetical protein